MIDQTASSALKTAELIKYLPDALIYTDVSGTILEWAGEAENVLGYSRAEMIGESLRKLFPLPLSEDIEQNLFGMIQIRGTFKNVVGCLRKDGAEVPLVCKGNAVFDEAGQISGYYLLLRAEAGGVDSANPTESEVFFRQVAEAIPLIVFVTDSLSHVSYFNQYWYTYTGRSRDAVDRGEWQSVVHPDDFERLMEIAKQSRLKNATFQAEYRLRRADGTYRWHLGRSVDILDVNGNFLKRLGTATDIDEEKKAREQLHYFLTQVPAPVCITRGPSRHIEFMNEAAWRLVSNKIVVVDPEDPSKSRFSGEAINEIIDEVFVQAMGVDVKEMALVRQLDDGTTGRGFYNVVFHPWRDFSGEVAGVMCLFLDVTEQIEIRRQIEDQAKWWQSILNLVPTPLFFCEPTKETIVFANRAAEEFSGADLGRRHLGQAMFPETTFTDDKDRAIPRADTPVARAARGESLKGYEGVWHNPVGRFPVIVNAEKLPAMYGHAATVVCALQDVSALKRTQGALLKALQARDQLLSISQRELREPLRVLQRETATLLERAGGEPTFAPLGGMLRELLAEFERRTDTVGYLVQDMLDIAGIGVGSLELKLERGDLSEIVRQVLVDNSSLLRQAGKSHEFVGGEGIVGHWDRCRVARAISLLLASVLRRDFDRPVTLSVTRDKDMACLFIGESALDRANRRFQQLPLKNLEGLGHGILLAKAIVESHGGSLLLGNEIERGLNFFLYLPLESFVRKTGFGE